MSAMNSSSSKSLENIYKNGRIYDRWGTELEYRQRNDGTGTGPVTGVANSNLPISRDPFFASAGPDRDWTKKEELEDEDTNTSEFSNEKKNSMA